MANKDMCNVLYKHVSDIQIGPLPSD